MVPTDDNENRASENLILAITLSFVTIVMVYLFIKIVFL